MSNPPDGQDMDKDMAPKPWRRASVLVPCLIVAALGVSIASVYLMPARVLAGLPTFVPRLGRSLGMNELGGARVVLEVASTEPAAVERTMQIARGRVRALGVPEPRISQLAANRILIEAPAYDDVAKLGALVSRDGRLTFQMIDPDPELGGALPGRVPSGEEKLPNAAGEYPPAFVVKKESIVTGSMLSDAQFTFANDQPAVGFRLDERGTHRFAAATTVNIGRRFAIALDGKVISAPVIASPITGGRGLISGHFTAQSAQELAALLKAGPLPATVTVVEAARVAPHA